MEKHYSFDSKPFHMYDPDYTSQVTRKCKCGHSVTIYSRFRRNICTNCGRFVYLTKKDEFIHRMQRKMVK